MILQGDCVEKMRELPEASVDAIVTDPPYGLEFMGKEWDAPWRKSGSEWSQKRATGPDWKGTIRERPGRLTMRSYHETCQLCRKQKHQHDDEKCPYPEYRREMHEPTQLRAFQSWSEIWATEALRVLKPGGHLLAFGGTRTYHRLACAIEDAGFEIRDSIAWQHMEGVFCACDDPMRRMREGLPDVPSPDPASEGTDLQPPVQRQASGPGVGDLRTPRREGSPEEAGSERSQESGLEGRRDAEASEGELHGSPVHQGAEVGAPDGPEGRLHSGTSASDGAADRPAADQNGMRPPSGSRPVEQRPDESGALAVEWIAQGGGAWPGCPRCGKPLAPPFFGGPLTWEYGSGFPKSLDVSKAIDKAQGAEREKVPATGGLHKNERLNDDGWAKIGQDEPVMDGSAPATPEAAQWEGWGTALKPAHEPIVLARKPLSGTVSQTVLEHGTGALNIDGTRIEARGRLQIVSDSRESENAYGDGLNGSRADGTTDVGRWPANVALDPEAAAMLDEQSGETGGGFATRGASSRIYGGGKGFTEATGEEVGYGDSGGASRFFYCAKSSRGERNAGLDGFEERQGYTHNIDGRDATKPTNAMGGGERARVERGEPGIAPRANGHPTVKPIDLMRWLVRLVTPPGGQCLDPFCGSGTTGIACVLEGFDFIGIEREPEYCEITRARIAFWEPHAGRDTEDVLVEAGFSERMQNGHREAGQLGLLDG